MNLNGQLNLFFEDLPKVDLDTFDIGNTHIKHAHFEKGLLQNRSQLSTLSEIEQKFESSPKVITSVKKEVTSTFSKNFSNKKFHDMSVHYAETLGHDRLISAYLIFHWLKNEEVVLLDCGTFLTVDLISPKGFEGGFIIPGIKTLGESYLRGEQLFEPEPQTIHPLDRAERISFPQSTKEAMSGGHALLLHGLVEKVQGLCEKRKVIVTGGGAELFLKNLPNAEFCPDLLHYAMYFQYVKNQI